MKKQKNKEAWWIYYRMGNADTDYDDHVVVLPSIGKLLLWIAKYWNRCCEVQIVLREG